MKLLKSSLLLFAILFTVVSTQSCKDECEDIVCQNGGTCNDGTCDCPDGFSGDNCETEDLCITNPIVCQNGGTSNSDCTECNCPDGYYGTSCENETVQHQLDNGIPPLELLNASVPIPIDSFYGKTYEGGFIFYLTAEGTGMVAATENQSTAAIWGCFGTNIMNLANVTECPGMGDCQQPLPEDTVEGARIGDGAANTDAILDMTNGCTEDGIAAKLCRGLGDDWFLPSRGELNLMYTNLHAEGHGGFAADWYWSSTEFDDGAAWNQDFEFGNQSSFGKPSFIHVRAARAF